MDRSSSGSPGSQCGNCRSCKLGGFWLLIFILAYGLPHTFAVPPLHGIAPKDLKYFETSTIWCRDKSKSFPRERLNDNFCDCADGTDEPGTSACHEGKFYCSNIGHRPERLFSSRVNDGICDCCDGSDEYDGQVKCPNTCWEAGKKLRAKLEKKLATFKEGLKLRTKDVEYARHKRKEQQNELSTLKKNEKLLKDVVDKLKEQVDVIEKAEKEEEMKREKAEQERREKQNVSVEDTGVSIEETLSDPKVEGEVEVPHIEKPEEGYIEEGDMEASDKSSEDSMQVEVPHIEKPEESYIEERGMEASDQSSEDTMLVEVPHIEKPEESYIEERDMEASDQSSEDTMQVEVPHIEKPEESYIEERDMEASDQSSEDTMQSGEHENVEALSKEELGKLVASRWTGKKPVNDLHDESVSATYENSHREHEEIEDADADEFPIDQGGTEDDTDLDNEDDEDEDEEDNDKLDLPSENGVSDTLVPPSSPWWKKILRAPKRLLKLMGVTNVQFDKSEIEQIKKEYSDANKKLSSLQQKISDMEHKLKQDFGKDGEFFSFYEQCFEIKLNKYLYKICPYKQATQEENHSTTRLGKWEGFKEDYRIMVFSNGDRCWNGPDRSLSVKLRCGIQNEILSVEEPSRCEYVAELATPALCLDSRLKALLEQQQQQQNAQSAQEAHEEL